jgi:hypothetical protein
VIAAQALVPQFVEEIPEAVEPGVFYVSLEHGSMIHLCPCGCGHEVALPLTPLDWRFTFDGETISVSPSVGSWSLPCRSHYIIDRGRVRWAEDWIEAEVEAGRRRDQARKDIRFNPPSVAKEGPEFAVRPPDETAEGNPRKGVLKGLRMWASRLWRG